MFAGDPLRIEERQRAGICGDRQLDVDQFARGVAGVDAYLYDTLLRPGEGGCEECQEQGASGHISNGSNRLEAVRPGGRRGQDARPTK